MHVYSLATLSEDNVFDKTSIAYAVQIDNAIYFKKKLK